MRIFYHRFKLTPIRALNRLSGTATREGLFLRSDQGGFWEYFPHPELGDQSCEAFLETPSPKALAVLERPLPKLDWKPFRNHGQDIIKVKLQHESDFQFLDQIQQGRRVRLDANGLFNPTTWSEFEAQIPVSARALIDYVEDPIAQPDWSGVGLKCARDFIEGVPFDVIVYKPYRNFFPNSEKPVIFSGHMGHALGTYLAYLELLERGDLTLVHGLLTPGLYHEVPELFMETPDGFTPGRTAVDAFLNHLEDLSWSER